MKPDLEALARRAVACPRWRWLPGMRYRVTRPEPLDQIVGRIPDLIARFEKLVPAAALPDFTDPATVGCLLALVREAYNAPHAYVEVRLGQRARVLSPEGTEGARVLVGWQVDTEAAALVAALEAAP